MNPQSTLTPSTGLTNAKAEAVTRFLKPDGNGNIIGVGIGKKQINDVWTDCLRIYVVRRSAEELIPPADLVPKGLTICGVPTDVIEVGRFGRKGFDAGTDAGTITRPGSPIRVKTGVTNVNEGARGTLGAVVTDGQVSYILSCNHVLRVNGRVPKDPDVAQVVSAEFVGTESKIADPDAFVRFQRDTGNSVDCAIARLKDKTSVMATFPTETVNLCSGAVIDPQEDMKVAKYGAGTGLTHGAVVDIDADLYVAYSFGTFRFDHQFVIESCEESRVFATNGDSGSVVVSESTESVGMAAGMIFAASGTFALACPMRTVLRELGYQLGRSLSLAVS